MEFCQYATMYEQSGAARHRNPLLNTVPGFYKAFKASLTTDPSFQIGARLTEERWYSASRPYFKVWPAILESLLKTKLDIPFSGMIGNKDTESVLAIRLPKGLHIAEMPGATAALITWHPFEKRGLGFMLCCQRTDGVFSSLHVPHASLDDSIESLDMRQVDEGEINEESVKCRIGFLRLAIAIRFLERDPDFIQPDVLAADRPEFDRTTDPDKRQRMIDRAKRKGIVGWRIGESYETIPHLRRPHFALFHTGKGRTVPRILPVKGCVVHRSKLTEVPTGYMDEDGSEVEG